MWANANSVGNLGIGGWTYNRANYKFDSQMQWTRYTGGRKFACKQVDMFRQDITDLASVTMVKMKLYAPLMTMSCGYCLTIFVEARSGLKFPAPPTFISGLYLQCLGVSFAFFTLGTWLVFHAALGAQAAMVQLRTRKVRVPVPTQHQMDAARQLLSNFEEQGVYDIFKIPFAMPHRGDLPEEMGKPLSSQSEAHQHQLNPGSKSGKNKKAGKTKKSSEESAPDAEKEAFWRAGMPGFKDGVSRWAEREIEAREEHPMSSPSGNGVENLDTFAHFELMRQAQKTYWGAEAYCRVCMLYGMIHLIMSFDYWLVIHTIAELAMVWCAPILAAAMTSAVWLMFRLDVLPEAGGRYPVEASGPFVAAVAMAMMYTHGPDQSVLDLSRAIGVAILIMQLLWTFRLYAIAKPGRSQPYKAMEYGSRLFNSEASCEKPSWLPTGFQHVTYLVSPPRPEGSEGWDDDDPMNTADMRPWYYTRAVLFATMIGWSVLLAGRIVECVMGERMLVSNPGAPPWTRTGMWDGWEHGPISSKHYAHVTPQRGHFGWQHGWGPQGQQELWASDMFGFAPEADMWWAEPDGEVGAAGHGENTWYDQKLKYGTYMHIAQMDGGHSSGIHEEADHGEHTGDEHSDGNGVVVAPNTSNLTNTSNMTGVSNMTNSSNATNESSGGHGGGGRRQLRGETTLKKMVRAVVPAAVQWPSLMEPELLACGRADGAIVVLTRTGMGAAVPGDAVAGKAKGLAQRFPLRGLSEFGVAQGASWGPSGLLVVLDSGHIASCAGQAVGTSGADFALCKLLQVPRLPLQGAAPAIAVKTEESGPMRAAVSATAGTVTLHELVTEESSAWREVGGVVLPQDPITNAPPKIASVSATSDRLLVTTTDGEAHLWELNDGRPVAALVHEAPMASQRTWRAGCVLPGDKLVRLASKWRRAPAGGQALLHELLL